MLHTLPGDRRLSSEVYAGELAAAIGHVGSGDVEVTHVRPESTCWRALRRPRLAQRFGAYLDHYVGYPWRARGGAADVHHVIEHGYAHLALCLPPERTVVTFHDAMLLKLAARELPVAFHPRLSMLANRLNVAGLNRAARIITVSEASRRDLVRFIGCDPARVSVIAEGASPRFTPDVRPRLRMPSAPARILHVGHCGFYKNIEAILRALPDIARRVPGGVEFIKAGGPFTAEQRALIARLGVGDRIRHIGVVHDAQLPEVYRGADLLVMPSLHEGFGLPVVEAMASGTPVVASNAGSLPEVVCDAGITVAPDDVAGLADACVRVLTDPLLCDEMRRRGIDRARSFTWERAASATLEVYRGVYEEAA